MILAICGGAAIPLLVRTNTEYQIGGEGSNTMRSDEDNDWCTEAWKEFVSVCNSQLLEMESLLVIDVYGTFQIVCYDYEIDY
jgi:hypothetical protein